MKDDDFKLLKGFALRWMNRGTDKHLNKQQAEKLKSREMKEG